jgi:hypothetical protein
MGRAKTEMAGSHGRPEIRDTLASPTRSPYGGGAGPKSPRIGDRLRPSSRFSPVCQASCCHSAEISCAQTAIIPTNSVIDASAAASSTNTRNIAPSLVLEHRENNVLFLFIGQARAPDRFGKRSGLVNVLGEQTIWLAAWQSTWKRFQAPICHFFLPKTGTFDLTACQLKKW